MLRAAVAAMLLCVVASPALAAGTAPSCAAEPGDGFRVRCTDPDADATGAEWYVDGEHVGNDYAGGTTASWIARLSAVLGPGSRTVAAVGFDATGRYSAPVVWRDAGAHVPEPEGVFRDEFDALALDRWTTFDGAGPTGCRGSPCFDDANAWVDDGRLRLRVQASGVGAQIAHTRPLAYGALSFSARVPSGAGGLFAVFAYACPPGEELDFVELPLGTRSFLATSYRHPDCVTQESQESIALPFDPADGFHVYSFAWTPGALTIFLDGAPAGTLALGGLDGPRRLYVSAWAPGWLSLPAKDAVVEVDWIEARPLRAPAPVVRAG